MRLYLIAPALALLLAVLVSVSGNMPDRGNADPSPRHWQTARVAF